MTKYKMHTIDLTDLMGKQKELTDFIRRTRGTELDWDKQRGAAICELWEVANELGSEGFKDWTDKKRGPGLLEETVDVLHFLLQMGNDLDAWPIHPHIEMHRTIMDQILELNKKLLNVGPYRPIFNWIESVTLYRGLVEMLGFDWEKDIIPAYIEKHDKNIQRQLEGY